MVAGNTEDTALGRARARSADADRPRDPSGSDDASRAVPRVESVGAPTSVPPPAVPNSIPPPSLAALSAALEPAAAVDPPAEPHEPSPSDAAETETEPALDWPAAAPSQGPLLQRVLQVLLLATYDEQSELLGLLHSDSLRVTCLSAVADVIASVHLDAPDLVLADEQLAHAGGLVAALRTDAAADASTDFVPIVLFESALGELSLDDDLDAAFDLLNLTPDAPDGRVPRPLQSEPLVRAIGRATGTLVEDVEPAPLGTLSVDELVDRFAHELRRGLVDTVVRGRSERMELGDGSEVLATAYGALASLRASVQRASSGRVEFEARGRNGMPSLVTPRAVLDLARADEFGPPDEAPLHGRRVILAEADTAIALLLGNLLREHGATVHEFTDGREAWEAARRERPAMVITGAQLPTMDGFALSRALARDPLLADVPLLLLPPKAELLSRTRDTAAALATDSAAQVVDSAVQLLAPRRALEARLKEPGELRGNLEGMGVMSILRSVRRARPDARVRIRDAWNLYECELREGRLAQVTRTASDGSFVRNERALPHLLGVVAGRFAVVEDHTPMKASFEGTLDEVLMRGARELAAELDAVSDERLERVARIVFDEDAYSLLVGQTPPLVHGVLEQLYAGAAPSTLVAEGVVDLHTLGSLLFDLARRGALRGVIGSAGEDLVAEARSVRAQAQPVELTSPLSVMPPAPNPVISMVAQPPRADVETLGGLPGVVELKAAEPVKAAPVRESAEQLARARGHEANLTDASELAAAAAEARRSRSTLAAWTVALLGLAAVAMFAGREAENVGADAMPEALGGSPTSKPPALSARQKGGSLISAEDNGFAVYDGILNPAAGVHPDQALLIVEATPVLAGATVIVNDRQLGPVPQQLALPEGVHELAIKRGDAISYRFVSVHPGRTWVLRNP
jgi:CheY-like chemotaxis protein